MGTEVISPVSTIQLALVTEVLTQTPVLVPPSQLYLMTLGLMEGCWKLYCDVRLIEKFSLRHTPLTSLNSCPV